MIVGLGRATQIRLVELRWPDGGVQQLEVSQVDPKMVVH
ncbi:MAG: hypothetical protein GWP91_20125 [Rhodobacterales bacterium]|nr:hypothetical protein [Rhodobacterales bacterium]